MRSLFLSVALSTMLITPAFALNVEVEALSDFSTDNPPKMYSVKIVEPIVTEKLNIESESILEGKIVAKDAQRLKRDATFSFVPTYLITPEGRVIKVKKAYTGKYKKEIDKGKIAKSVALSAGNMAVKGFSTGFTAVEGLVKNEEGNRLKSSAVAVYESTPLSYVEKGKALQIKKGDHFYINFNNSDNDSSNAD